MHLRQRLVWYSLLVFLTCHGWLCLAEAGTIGFPVPRQQFLHLRVEIVGDSFREDLHGSENVKAKTGRALATVAMGLASWSEIYARIGLAEFNIDAAGFNGDFGLAYGGGLRLQLVKFPVGSIGLTSQYLRFTSVDHNSAGERLDGTWDEIDVVLGFGTKQFGAFQFYLGGVYNHSDVTIEESDNDKHSFEEKIPARLLLGVNLYPLLDFPRNEFLVNFEVRLIGEIPQFTMGLQYAF